MAGSYILCNKLHNNGLMTDWGLSEKESTIVCMVLIAGALLSATHRRRCPCRVCRTVTTQHLEQSALVHHQRSTVKMGCDVAQALRAQTLQRRGHQGRIPHCVEQLTHLFRGNQVTQGIMRCQQTRAERTKFRVIHRIPTTRLMQQTPHTHHAQALTRHTQSDVLGDGRLPHQLIDMSLTHIRQPPPMQQGFHLQGIEGSRVRTAQTFFQRIHAVFRGWHQIFVPHHRKALWSHREVQMGDCLARCHQARHTFFVRCHLPTIGISREFLQRTRTHRFNHAPHLIRRICHPRNVTFKYRLCHCL
uniref:Uncharacterized protein n=1 Tax=Siphoviridae sp. ctOWj17 TaxID=2826312 RepID=A0A8S5QT01_9CAUD|nr:MAG TPA: hypothetical protein [Siphoviridae sp. ctOWj17]